MPSKEELGFLQGKQGMLQSHVVKAETAWPHCAGKMVALAFNTYVPVHYTVCQHLFFIDLYDNSYQRPNIERFPKASSTLT